MQKLPLLLSLSEAAELTGLSVKYISKLRRVGVIKTYQMLGGRHKYHRDDLLKHVGIKSN
ncbi:MAG: helix-turn-helix domain-containing protein [Alphaproteobacteria bacterium]